MLNYSFIGKVIHKHIWETASLNCESSKKKAERVGGREWVWMLLIFLEEHFSFVLFLLTLLFINKLFLQQTQLILRGFLWVHFPKSTKHKLIERLRLYSPKLLTQLKQMTRRHKDTFPVNEHPFLFKFKNSGIWAKSQNDCNVITCRHDPRNEAYA